MIDFNGQAWAIIGNWVEVHDDEIGFERTRPCGDVYYLTFYEAAWAGFIEKYAPMGEGI